GVAIAALGDVPAQRFGVPVFDHAKQPHLAVLDGGDLGVSRPKEFHLRPLAEPDVNLSAHPAPTTLRYDRFWECRSACRSCRIPPGFPVDPPCLPDGAAPSLLRHYSGLNATTSGSVPWRRIATVGLALRACAFRLPSPPKVPAVQRKSLKQDRAASMPDVVWPVSRCRPDRSQRNETRWFRRLLTIFDT